MKRRLRSIFVLGRTLVLSAMVAVTFSGCALLGAAIQLVGKAVNAFAGNTADAIPVRVNVSIPLRADAEGAEDENELAPERDGAEIPDVAEIPD